MKKIVWLSLMALCFPLVGMAQSIDDDLYYTPKKSDDSSPKKEEKAAYSGATNGSVYAMGANPATTVIVRDLEGNVRDVDEYNRRFTSFDNDFEMENDTLVIQEKKQSDRGEWVNGFNGTQDDYEYAQRIIRFRSPGYAIPITSPFYWDIVYGVDSWNWNVYNDGYYAYAFPAFNNNLWFDWRFGSFSLGMNWGWNYPYYSWGGWGPSWNWGHHHHHYPNWCGSWYGNTGSSNNFYYNNRRSSSTSVRNPSYNLAGASSRPVYSTSRPTGGRVVGTRTNSTSRPGSSVGFRPGSDRIENSSAQRPSYTRPSSTRPSTSSRSGSSYNRGSSPAYTRPSGSSTADRPSYDNSNRSSYSGSNSRSSNSNYSSGKTSRSSGSSYSGGSTSRSSGSGVSRSGGGSSSGGGSRSGSRR